MNNTFVDAGIAAARAQIPAVEARLHNLSPGLRRRVGLGIVCAVLAGPVAGASATHLLRDPIDAGRQHCRLFEDVDGLPQNTVHALLVDRAGSLWVGTQDGAAAYDGHSWQRLDLPDAEQSNFVRAMMESRDGSLWFGRQAGGLSRYRNGHWANPDFGTTGLATQRVNALLETPREGGGSDVWVGTAEGGLLRYDGESWTRFDVAAGLPSSQVWALLETGSGADRRLWIGTGSGPVTMRLSDGAIEVPPGAPHDSISSLFATSTADGTLSVWAATYGGGLLRSRGGVWSRLGLADGLPSLFLTDLAASPSGGKEDFWIATDGGGLAEWRSGEIRTIDLGALLASHAIYKVLETRAEQGARAVWIGTRNNGLIRMTEGLWRAFEPFPETPSVPVTAILQRAEDDGSDSLWLGTDGYGVALWRHGVWRRIDTQSGEIGHNTVLALTESRSIGGRRIVWVGTRNGGLASFDGERWRRYTQANGALPNDLVQTVLETEHRGKGTLWVGTRSGLAAYDGEHWRRADDSAGFPATSILSLLGSHDAQGDEELWVGSTSGLFRYAGGKWTNWDQKSGLRNAAVQSLHESRALDGRRTLWIGTDGGGVALLAMDDPAPQPRPFAGAGSPALPNGSVYSILEDSSRRLYLLTNSGVSRLTPTRDGFRQEEFTTEHGLPLNQGNRGAGLVDRHGRIWFGTVGGAAAFDPALEFRDRWPKRLRLRAQPADCENCELLDRGVLRHGQNRILFHYALLSFFGEPLTRYRSQLVGLDAAPSDWAQTDRREVGALAPGNYTFRVWGRDASGNISGPTELSFSILPAPWQTRWAQLLALLATALAVLLVLRLRSGVHARRERALEELVDARTRQLQRANDLLVDLSYVDALTSVPNRRRFDELFREEWRRCLRAATPLAVVMVDIDGFKGYNDAFGHQAGDACLKSVALSLADGLVRSGDAVARYGGEEFGVILPSTDGAGALLVAEHLRRRVERLAILAQPARAIRVVTVSCGVAATVPTIEQDSAELFRRADEALYRAKRAGGNATELG
ncbi:MAG: diguanylate cyclase [Thermoanaerobaculia bacterium]